TEQVGKYEQEFDALLRTVKMHANYRAVPDFTLPAGWTKTGPRTVKRMGVSIKIDETLRFGPPDAQLEVTITGSTGGSTIQNFDRWAKQVGNTDSTDEDYAKSTREFDTANGKGL